MSHAEVERTPYRVKELALILALAALGVLVGLALGHALTPSASAGATPAVPTVAPAPNPTHVLCYSLDDDHREQTYNASGIATDCSAPALSGASGER